MSASGGNLFGTRVIWAGIVAIAVIFVLWAQIISCNETNAAKEAASRNSSMATSAGAIEYCKEFVRRTQGDRQRFGITDGEAARRATPTHFDVRISYQYWDSYRRVMRPDSAPCAVGYSGEWRMLRR